MNGRFPDTPAITLYDPLADLLGAGDGRFTYRFEDAVKLAGHACPTVAGAFLMAVRALEALYGDDIPCRGAVRIEVPGAADEGVNGPISQVFTLITGAAGDNGFQGLGGRFSRHGLMHFGKGGTGPFRFQRVDTGQSVTVAYDPSPFPPAPELMPLLQQIRQVDADPALRQRFQELWRERVLRILADGGRQSVTLENRAMSG